MEIKSGVLRQRYELGRLLGQGAFAKVYYARSIQTGQSVAIKVIDKKKVLRVGLMDQIKREISVMGMVRHSNIVYLYEVMASRTKIYFVMEYAKGGELFDKLTKGRLEEEVAQKYFRQLISAVDFCHSRGVFHRDLKTENLLLDENENLKVSDFGLSALADCKRQDGLLHTICGTPAYVAPEIISRIGYDGDKVDIWSCGVILFVLLAGYLPFHDSNLIEMYRRIGKAEYRCPSWFPKDARRVLRKILDPNPDSRITIAKIRESSWFRNNLSPKQVQSESDTRKFSDADTSGDPGPSRRTTSSEESRQEQIKPAELNAFDIISLSCGFDLSGLFDDSCHKMEARFTSMESSSVIISVLIEMAKSLRLKARRMDKGLLKFEAITEGKKGALSIDAEIFEVTPELFFVEMRKADGDTFEYQKLLKEDIRPALKDIVWAWEGDQQQQQPLFEQPMQNQQQKLLKEDIRPALKDIVWAWEGDQQQQQQPLFEQPMQNQQQS